jgi:hypothetical protein
MMFLWRKDLLTLDLIKCLFIEDNEDFTLIFLQIFFCMSNNLTIVFIQTNRNDKIT